MTETPTVERETSEPTDEIAGALAAFQAEMPTVLKGKTAKVDTRDGRSYSYTYADLADVTAAAMPVLAKHGLAFVTVPEPGRLVGLLLHTSGQRLTGILPIAGQSPQQIGSALTYMRRYLLGCMTGIVTDDDDDGQRAEQAARPPQRRPRDDDRPPVAPPAPQRSRRPVTAADVLATEDNPAPDGSVDVPLPEPAQKAPASQVQAALFATWRELWPDNETREDRLAKLAAIVGRPVSSANDLDRNETYRVLGFLERVRNGAAGIVRREGAWHAVSYEEPPNERA